jgi:prophage regulatory protein
MDAVKEAVLNPVQPHMRALCALPDILSRGKFSKSHVYNLMSRGQFPLPVLKLGPRFTRWSEQEINSWFADPSAWIAAHAQGASA